MKIPFNDKQIPIEGTAWFTAPQINKGEWIVGCEYVDKETKSRKRENVSSLTQKDAEHILISILNRIDKARAKRWSHIHNINAHLGLPPEVLNKRKGFFDYWIDRGLNDAGIVVRYVKDFGPVQLAPGERRQPTGGYSPLETARLTQSVVTHTRLGEIPSEGYHLWAQVEQPPAPTFNEQLISPSNPYNDEIVFSAEPGIVVNAVGTDLTTCSYNWDDTAGAAFPNPEQSLARAEERMMANRARRVAELAYVRHVDEIILDEDE